MAPNGNVVGIVVSKLGDKFTRATGQRAENVGYAINVARLRALIDTTPDVVKTMQTQPSRGLTDRPKLVAQVESSVVLISARPSGALCNEEGDIEIPAFGQVAKSRSELAREQREARERHQARIEAEKSEIQRKEREAARAALDRAKEREAEEARKLERNAEREKLAAQAKSRLAAIHENWREIEASPGFHYWSSRKFPEGRSRLFDPETGISSPDLLHQYIRDIIGNPNSSATSTSMKPLENLISGELIRAGRLVFSDTKNGYGIALISKVDPTSVSDLVIFDGTSATWLISHPDRIRGDRISFLTDPRMVGTLMVDSDVFVSTRKGDK